MRLAISNILWPAAFDAAAFTAVRAAGVSAVELAPARIAPWAELTPAVAQTYRARLAGLGLTVSSLQAVLFGVADVALLEDEARYRRLADHLARVGDLAAALGARVIVFGAPKQRLRGALDFAAACALAAARLKPIGDALAARGVVLGIEAVPAAYGADFLHNIAEVAPLVRMIASPGIKLHLDTGALHLAGEDPAAVVAAQHDILYHVHLSRPQLAPLTAPLPLDAPLAAALRQHAYQGWLSIEIGPQEQPLPVITQAVAVARTAYGV